MHRFYLGFVLAFLISASASAAPASTTVRLAKVFGSRMVIQRGRPAPVWGWGTPEQTVIVSFGNQVKQGKVGADGAWEVTLDAMEASFEGRSLRAAVGGARVTISDVLVGELWVNGGQSNMEPKGHKLQDLEWPSADTPAVRVLFSPRQEAPAPAENWPHREKWHPLVAEQFEHRRVSPISYYFGVRLRRFLNVPVGIINTAIGGTIARTWATRSSLEAEPALKIMLERSKDIGAWYNGVLAPIAKLQIAGVLFYQGENNTFDLFEDYAYTFPCLVRDWQKTFRGAPFGIISLCGNKAYSPEPEPEGVITHRHAYTHIRDVHFRTYRSTPNTGLITIWDLGEDNMHSSYKRGVGERAARWALATVYGKNTVYHMAPVYREHKVEGNKILLYFDYDPSVTEERLHKWYKRLPLPHRGGPYRGFIIAGENQQFFPAQVKVRAAKTAIREECLEVWSDFVEKPVAVRYAWENQPNANAWGYLGDLPVAPFRTDDWAFIRAIPNYLTAEERAAREASNKVFVEKQKRFAAERRLLERVAALRQLGYTVTVDGKTISAKK